jgi:hypothetical protein
MMQVRIQTPCTAATCSRRRWTTAKLKLVRELEVVEPLSPKTEARFISVGCTVPVILTRRGT